jgi:hypothetical protein
MTTPFCYSFNNRSAQLKLIQKNTDSLSHSPYYTAYFTDCRAKPQPRIHIPTKQETRLPQPDLYFLISSDECAIFTGIEIAACCFSEKPPGPWLPFGPVDGQYLYNFPSCREVSFLYPNECALPGAQKKEQGGNPPAPVEVGSLLTIRAETMEPVVL